MSFKHIVNKRKHRHRGKRWTAIFIIATDNKAISLEDARNLVNELHDVRLTKHINMVLCISTRVDNMRSIYPKYPNKCGLRDDEFVTAIYVIKKSRRHKGNDFMLMREAENFNLQCGADIAAFFEAATENVYKGQRFIMFTWDHGCIYNIFRKDDSIKSDIKNVDHNNSHEHKFEILMATKLRNYQHKLTIHKALHTVEFDGDQEDNTPEFLTVRELCEAIRDGMGGRKIEVMVMTNCYMQAFDTGYELSNVVDYLVAPETFIVMTGFHYRKILNEISFNPRLQAKRIAQLAIASYFEKSKGIQDERRRAWAINEVAVSAVDLKHYYKLASVIDEMAKILTEGLKNDHQLSLIKQARKMLDPVEPKLKVMMVDPYFFFNDIGALLNDTTFNLHLDEFNSSFHNAVVKLFAGEYFGPGRLKERFRPKGFTVYFPLMSYHINRPLADFLDDNSPYAAAFASHYSWDNFVIKFAKKVGPEL